MPGAKKTVQAPIDRPLGKAYLRQFTGWSTAYPPGLSEPTSVRLMENCYVTPEAAMSVRPALRSVLPPDTWLNNPFGATAVGSFEPFFLNDGTKALLFAARSEIVGLERVGFKVAVQNDTTGYYDVKELDDASVGFSIPQGEDVLAFTATTTYVTYVQIDNKIFALSNAGETLRMFSVGTTKVAKALQSITEPDYVNEDRLTVHQPTAAWVAGSQVTTPPAITLSTTTLTSTTTADNQYSFAYFYTFNNEIGESAASMLTVMKTQRRWSVWAKNTANDAASTDQITAVIPEDVWDNAVAEGAISWNLYMLTWSDQDAVPVEGTLLRTTQMGGKTYDEAGWAAQTPLLEGLDTVLPLPNASNRYNYSQPSSAGQGLVAGDRLVLVNDRNAAAVIRWSSNQQGSYTDFSASKGGGYKTLTSGNLYIPSSVKLWQNPQSIDTITILCAGVNGESTGYYMEPGASVNGGSQAQVIMGFEETTATPGTTSPYGCEVLNNALYHPLDGSLMKSTAANYNINHKLMTDKIRNKWTELRNKHKIVSSQLDNKLYFIVDNPDGVEVPEHCNGNEIWVCDTTPDGGNWSRWLIPAVSLRRLEVRGKVYMAVVLPDTIAILDMLATMDTTQDDDSTTLEVPIPWKFETNTQGGNRAHDMLVHLQQVNVTFGNFQGAVTFGIRGRTIDGKDIDWHKTWRDNRAVDMSTRPAPYDLSDFFLVQRQLVEWRFYAESVPDELSVGQVSLVQYRFVPLSVNAGYEYGSTQTYEYQYGNQADSTTFNGVPIPVVDTTYP